MKVENDLGRDHVLKLVLRIAGPSMLAQFVSVLYSIVDRIYIGNIPEVGDLALAGVGICGPVVTMVGSFAALVGMGGAPYMSITMGEGNMEKAKTIMANCFLLLTVGAAVLMAILFPIRRPMLLLFGASEVTLSYAMDYFTIYLSGTFFALLSLGMNQLIISQGFASVGMFSVLLGAIGNIVLDPVFMFGLGMGVKGAAVATVLSQFASCVFVLAFLSKKELPVSLSFGNYRWDVIKHIIYIGMTPFLIIAVDNVMIILMNTVLQKYGGPQNGDMLITCATIAQSFLLVVTMPLGGISAGTQTILGFNYGAGDGKRVRQAQYWIVLLCVAYTTLMFVLARVAGDVFVGMFTSDTAVAEKALWAIRVCTIGIIPLGVQYAIVDGFTGMGQVQLSFPLSFFRKGVYFLALFLAPALWGAEAAFYSQPISDFVGTTMSICVYFIMIGRVLSFKNKEAALQST